MTPHFWQLPGDPAGTVLIQGDRHVSRAELLALNDAWRQVLSWTEHRTLGFLLMPNEVSAIACYLACLQSGQHVPLLIQATASDHQISALCSAYLPDWVVLPAERSLPDGFSRVFEQGGIVAWRRTSAVGTPSHRDLALLLSTSGTTGSSKFVRLSASALSANARSVSTYLDLTQNDTAITTLPLAYSFGMSILNSHLASQGRLVLSDLGPMDRGFWDVMRAHAVTSLSGVPATFEMLRRFDLARLSVPDVRMMTQAGGRLRDDLVRHFEATCSAGGRRFFVMYGQTEASPRISYVPPERLANKIGSIGVPVPGGAMEMDADTGELIYSGPNVMMGYAESRDDLSKGDEMNGVLRTGDLVRLDDDGYFYITGRLKRFVKVSGNRVNLDDVEHMLSAELGCQVACAGSDDALCVFLPEEANIDQDVAKRVIQTQYKLFRGHVKVFCLSEFPTLSSGKLDYARLRSITEESVLQ